MRAEVRDMLARLRDGGITDERLIAAMESVPREEFVPAPLRAEAYADRALGIGCEQTISQPLMVATMVQAMEVGAGTHVLDVGTGSGYQAAVLAAMGARVVSVERNEELARTASERLRRLGFEVDVHLGDGTRGVGAGAPYDAIGVAASAPRMPAALARQLAEGGRLVLPLHRHGEPYDRLTRMRAVNGRWLTDDLGPCLFVPLIGADAYPDAGAAPR
ncbi:MAG: protein-L-isoaspartate(D-aspartate) O-methyltransferase [Candidatus Dormibacteria bacterium]